MQRLFAILMFLCLALATAFSQEDVLAGAVHQKMATGKIYAHTVRGFPHFEIDGKTVELKNSDFIDAQNISVETVTDQCVTLVFSNKTAIYVCGSAKFFIEKFEQAQPFGARPNTDDEPSRSLMRINVEKGEIFVSTLKARPSSKLIVKTPFGVYEPQSRAFRIKANADEVRLDLMEGRARFHTHTDKSDFLQIGQSGFATKDSAQRKYPLNPQILPMLEADSYMQKVKFAKAAANSTLFYFNDDGQLEASRVVSTDFFLKKPKHDFRPN